MAKYEPEEIESAAFCAPPAFIRSPRRSGRRAEGLRYEKKAQEMLCTRTDLYLPGPWIKYFAAGKACWCQPDGLHFDFLRGVITVVEIKLTHTAEAVKLSDLYQPVVQKLFPPHLWRVRLVEITRWYDPDVKFPGALCLCGDPFRHDLAAIGVFTWRP